MSEVERELKVKIAKIHARVLALVVGSISGLAVFVMTTWLLLKGDPNPGPHLQLLAQYFPGYSVTWFGSMIGTLYGSLLGGLIGWFIGTVYNRVADLKRNSSQYPPS